MSTFAVKIRQAHIFEHPNADALELGQVDDYRVVVRKGEFPDGTIVVYIPEQAILPEPLILALGLEGKLSGAEKNRVRAVRLRGELSQGLLYRPTPWPEHWVEGLDVADELGIVKWEPPIPTAMEGEVTRAPGDGFFRTYTDIENIKGWPDVLQEGEPVIFSEKLHGTNMASALIDGERVVSSKGIAAQGLCLRESATNVYWRAAIQEGLFAKLGAYMAAHDLTRAILYGEVLGVQDLMYGLTKGSIAYRAFDLYTPAGFVPFAEFQEFCMATGITPVPLLYEGPFSKAVMLQHTSGKSTLAAHIREGIVIRPVAEREIFDLGRVVLKSVSGDYLTRKGGTEAQ